ncbi:hypothetical protein [Novosphingobium pentaromativorans]|uniref:hypothetical protein n=1 Tax=Novosphingobium pentaromativorans TaxID=205844 RepID=UPI00110FC8A7|nr:hypothetical protein [Novosphingobium pentaromativorans]
MPLPFLHPGGTVTPPDVLPPEELPLPPPEELPLPPPVLVPPLVVVVPPDVLLVLDVVVPPDVSPEVDPPVVDPPVVEPPVVVPPPDELEPPELLPPLELPDEVPPDEVPPDEVPPDPPEEPPPEELLSPLAIEWAPSAMAKLIEPLRASAAMAMPPPAIASRRAYSAAELAVRSRRKRKIIMAPSNERQAGGSPKTSACLSST